MKATARKLQSTADVAARVDAIDWTQATADLDGQGCAVLKGLLSRGECQTLAALYPTIGQLRRAPELAAFLKWVRKQPPSRRKRNVSRRRKI